MAKLTRQQVVTIQVLHQRGQPATQTARLLGVPEGTVRYHRRRARDGAADGRKKPSQVEQTMHCCRSASDVAPGHAKSVFTYVAVFGQPLVMAVSVFNWSAASPTHATLSGRSASMPTSSYASIRRTAPYRHRRAPTSTCGWCCGPPSLTQT